MGQCWQKVGIQFTSTQRNLQLTASQELLLNTNLATNEKNRIPFSYCCVIWWLLALHKHTDTPFSRNIHWDAFPFRVSPDDWPACPSHCWHIANEALWHAGSVYHWFHMWDLGTHVQIYQDGSGCSGETELRTSLSRQDSDAVCEIGGGRRSMDKSDLLVLR